MQNVKSTVENDIQEKDIEFIQRDTSSDLIHEKIKKLFRDGVKEGEIYLSGLPEDKKKIMKEG